jgi:quercetin dioxygenase-like cupin family protein
MLSSLEVDGGLNLVDCTWPAGTHVPSHVHPAEDELLIILAGTVEVRIAERSFRCGAGETLFTPRNTEHEVRALSKARHIAILTRKSLERPRTV